MKRNLVLIDEDGDYYLLYLTAHEFEESIKGKRQFVPNTAKIISTMSSDWTRSQGLLDTLLRMAVTGDINMARHQFKILYVIPKVKSCC